MVLWDKGAYRGVDTRTRTIHTITAIAANVHDSKVLAQLMHGIERRLYGDSAYRRQIETCEWFNVQADGIFLSKIVEPVVRV